MEIDDIELRGTAQVLAYGEATCHVPEQKHSDSNGRPPACKATSERNGQLRVHETPVETRRRILAVPVAEAAAGVRVPVRVVIEQVVRAQSQRHPAAQGVAGAGVQEAVAVEIQRFLRVVPAAVVAVAEQQV